MCHELSNRLSWAWARRSSRRHVLDVDEPTTSRPTPPPVCVDPIDYAIREARIQAGAKAIDDWLGEQAYQD